MRFPWQKRLEQRAAKRAREEAEKRHAEIRAQWPEVHAQAAQSRFYFQENGISLLLNKTFSGKRKP